MINLKTMKFINLQKYGFQTSHRWKYNIEHRYYNLDSSDDRYTIRIAVITAFPRQKLLLECTSILFISVINQLYAQNFCFTISLFDASTCFEHMCSSLESQNCITQPLVSSRI